MRAIVRPIALAAAIRSCRPALLRSDRHDRFGDRHAPVSVIAMGEIRSHTGTPALRRRLAYHVASGSFLGGAKLPRHRRSVTTRRSASSESESAFTASFSNDRVDTSSIV